MSTLDQSGCRKITFNIKETEGAGLQFPIGRASFKDPQRSDQNDNFMYHEKSLSKKHAMLCIKRLIPSDDDPFVPLLCQFRISVQDLGSTHGLVDLQSQDSEASIIDLKNGERFGLIRLHHPIAPGQSRGAKLKFQVLIKSNENEDDDGTLDLILRNVTHEDSPYVSRPATSADLELETQLTLSSCSTSSSSEMNYSEDLDLELDEKSGEPDVCCSDSDDVAVQVSQHTLFVTQETTGVEEEATVGSDHGSARYKPFYAPHSDYMTETGQGSYDDANTLEGTPQCFDCSNTANSYNEDEMEDCNIYSPIYTAAQFLDKKRVRERDNDEDSVAENEERKKVKQEIEPKRQHLALDITKQAFVGGVVGLLAGSLGTLGVLVGIANM